MSVVGDLVRLIRHSFNLKATNFFFLLNFNKLCEIQLSSTFRLVSLIEMSCVWWFLYLICLHHWLEIGSLHLRATEYAIRLYTGAVCSVVVTRLYLDPQGRWFDPRCGHDKICTAVGPLSKALNPSLLQGVCLLLSLINCKLLWIKASAKWHVIYDEAYCSHCIMLLDISFPRAFEHIPKHGKAQEEAKGRKAVGLGLVLYGGHLLGPLSKNKQC